MANPSNPDIEFVETEPGLNNPVEIETVTVGDRAFAYVTSRFSDSVDIFEITTDGEMQPVGTVSDTSAVSLDSPSGLTSHTINGTNYLFVGGEDDDGVTSYKIRANGTLLLRDAEFDDEDSSSLVRLQAVSEGLDAFDIGKKTFLAVSSRLDSGIQLLEVNKKGKLKLGDSASSRDSAPDAFDYKLNLARDLEHVSVGNRDFLYVITDQSALSSWEVDNSGDLTFLTSDNDNATLRMFSAEGIASAKVNNATYLFVAGNDEGISTFRVANNGALSNVSNFVDEEGTVLDDVKDLEAFKVEGNWFLTASDNSTDSIGVYRIANNGSLTEVDAIVDTAESALSNVQASGAVTLPNGQVVLLGAGETSDGALSSFLLDVGQDITGPIVGNGKNNKLKGTKKAELIEGLGGKDVLKGRSGDDTLDGGRGNDRLEGDGGDDTFVFQGQKFGKDRVLDFEPGEDTVVLSEPASARAFLNALRQNGDDVVYDLGRDGKNTITFLNLDVDDFSRSDVEIA